MGVNADKLWAEGLIDKPDLLPADYIAFLDGLTPNTITELVSLKQTLKSKHDIEAVPVRLKEKGWLQIFAVKKSMPVL